MDIDTKVDRLLTSKGMTTVQKQQFWNHMLAVGDFLIAFLLVSMAFVPFFDKQLSFGVGADESGDPLGSGNNETVNATIPEPSTEGFEIGGINFENINVTWFDTGDTGWTSGADVDCARLNNSYIDVNLSSYQLFIPDELDNASFLQYRLEEWWEGDAARIQYNLQFDQYSDFDYPTEDLSALLGWNQFADSVYPANYFQTGSRETHAYYDENKMRVFDVDELVDIETDFNVSWKLNVSADYGELIIDYELWFSNETTTDLVHTFTDIYEVENPSISDTLVFTGENNNLPLDARVLKNEAKMTLFASDSTYVSVDLDIGSTDNYSIQNTTFSQTFNGVKTSFYPFMNEEGSYFEFLIEFSERVESLGFTCYGLDFKIENNTVIFGNYLSLHPDMVLISGEKNSGFNEYFKIREPIIIDSIGTYTTGTFYRENGKLYIDIPEDFLDNAEYPIIVDPTFESIQLSDGNIDDAKYLSIDKIDNDSDYDLNVMEGYDTWNWYIYYQDDGGEKTFTLDDSLSSSFTSNILFEDFNGDGHPDRLWSRGFNSHYIQYYEADGSGGWENSPSWSNKEGFYPSSQIGDIDGDGELDIFTGDEGGCRWYENDGTESFTEHTISSGYVCDAAALYDIDGDGDLDGFIISDEGADVGNITICYNDGSGNFTTSEIASLSDDSARDLDIQDFDEDGEMDLCIVLTDVENITIFINNSDGTFTRSDVLSASGSDMVVNGAMPGQNTTGDVNRDGHIDIVYSYKYDSNNTYALRYLPGDGDGTFGNPLDICTNVDEWAVGDIDEDGDDDVLFCTRGTTGSVYVYYCVVGNPYFSNYTSGNYNVSLDYNYTIDVFQDDGENCVVDFYLSTDNSTWSHIKNDGSIQNETAFVVLTGNLERDTLYYIKTTADANNKNASQIASFEITPYATNYFNTTFHTENWVQSTSNMSFEDSFYNTSFIPTVDDVNAGNWCNPNPTDGYMGITNVQLNDLDRTTSDSNVFEDETDYGTVLTTGTSYTMKVTLSGSYTQYVNVYIDYNIDGDFTDAGEWIGGTSGENVQVSFSTSNIQETTDSTAMMVHSQYAGNFSNPCSQDYGDCEIYSVTSESIVSTAYLISENITKQSDNWDKFYADVNNTVNSTFSLIDPLTDHTIISGLNGDGDDISSVNNNTVRVRGDFNATLSLDSINLSWSSGGAANNAPMITGESPSNQSTDISLQPTCNVTVADADSDSMNVTFASNYSGSWTNYQTNTTVSTGSSVSWSFTGANSYDTTYWWRVYADDSADNTSETYYFTTAASETWQTISNNIGDGTLSNTTNWKTISDSIGDGSISHTSSWQTISNAIGDGALSNTTTWRTISDTIGDGTLGNTTSWQTISNTIGDGSISNTTSWQTISDSVGDGSLGNTTIDTWQTISSTIGDGTLSNTTTWKTISDTIGNGIISNTTNWQTISNSIGDGTLSNSTGWKTISNAIGDGALGNTTSWKTISDSIGDGSISHTSSWQTISNTIGDGTLSNTTSWTTISNTIGDGTLGNTTVSTWQTISSTIGDGTLSNTTTWSTISNTFGDGSISNTTSWTTISTTIGDGILSHSSTWQSISSTIGNGIISNTTNWQTISNTIGDGILQNISTKPVFTNPHPANNSIVTPTDPTTITLTWNITITDNTGSFNYTITCNNDQNTSNNETTNGSKTISLTGLTMDTTYTIWVNATRNNTDQHTNEIFYFTIAEGNMTGNYDYSVEGQTISLTPRLQPGVTNYKWVIEDENGNKLTTTNWIDYSDSKTHKSILEFNKTYIVYLFIKNNTLHREIGKKISTVSMNATTGDKDDFRDYTPPTTEENETTEPKYKNLFDNVPLPIKNFFGHPIVQILTAIAAVTLFLTFLKKKPKKYLYIRQKKNERK